MAAPNYEGAILSEDTINEIIHLQQEGTLEAIFKDFEEIVYYIIESMSFKEKHDNRREQKLLVRLFWLRETLSAFSPKNEENGSK